MTFTDDPGRATPEAVAAATVILLRDGDDGLETLMLRRNSKLAFAGGHWVFPGGRVDPADLDPGDADPGGADAREMGAARRAAVREAAEEAGLVVDVAGLVPFAHWTPPAIAVKRFATWFFLAPAPTGVVTIDGGEIHDHTWVGPAEAITRRDQGEMELSPPTWRSLHRLSHSATMAEALAEAEAADIEHFVTQIARVEGGAVALWHGDAGYEAADALAPGARHRLWMVRDGWRYERFDDPTGAAAGEGET